MNGSAFIPPSFKAVRGTKDGAGGKAGDAKTEEKNIVLTPEALSEMIKSATAEAVKGLKLPEGAKIDEAAFVQRVAETVTEAQKKAAGTKDEKAFDFGTLPNLIATAVKGAVEGIKFPSRHESQSPSAEIDFPISHRAGNLTVGAKQLLNICTRKSENDGITDAQVKDARMRGLAIVDRLQKMAQLGANVKAIVTTGSPGSQFINTDLSSDILQRLYLQSDLAARMLSQEIQMPTDPYKIPVSTTRPAFKIGGQTSAWYTTNAGSNPGATQATLTTTKLIAHVVYSYEQDEDSIVPMLPWLQNQLGIAAAETYETALINGDTTATHQDSDVTASDDPRKSWAGFRKYALAQTATKIDLGTGGISVANLVAIRKLLKKWGVRPADLIWLAGPSIYNDFIGLAESLKVSDVGQGQARLLTGEAPQIFGIPIVTSEAMREDLNATGVYDGTTTTKKSLLLVNKSQWIMGSKRDFFLETGKDIINQQNVLVASFRRAFIPQETPSASLPFLAYGYNMA